jgi:sulfur carrier protein ThiS
VRVEVHLHADLERYAPGGRRGVISLVLPIGAQVADVLREVALPGDRRILIGLNGAAAQPEQVLDDGARIDLVPPIAGGSFSSVHGRRPFRKCRTVTGIAFSTSI